MDHEQLAQVQQVQQHYNDRANETHKERQKSAIYHLRQFNNWLKFVLIDLHTKPGCSVLDFCCGKGGDLHKWHSVGCTSYVGCDIADRSVTVAVDRYNEMLAKSGMSFRPKLLVGDLFSVRLSKYLPADCSFNVVSCQFSMHYAFESEKRVRQLLLNVSERLCIGGFFIGTTIDSNVLIRKIRAVDQLHLKSPVYYIQFDEKHASKKFPILQPNNTDTTGSGADKLKKKKAKQFKRRKTSNHDNDEKGDDNDDGGDSDDDDDDDSDDNNQSDEKDDDDDDDDDDENDDSENDDSDDDERRKKKRGKPGVSSKKRMRSATGDKKKDNDGGDGSSSSSSKKQSGPYGIRYTFKLDTNVDYVPEYIVHFPSFKQVAAEYGLELVMLCNFHDFFTEFSSEQYPNYRRKMFALRVVDDRGTISADEWDAIYLYTAFAFKKTTNIKLNNNNNKTNLTTPTMGASEYHHRDRVETNQWESIDKDEIIMMQQ